MQPEQASPIRRALGRYELLSELGRGGMANVYLGRLAGEAGFQRLYAIKVLHAHLADQEGFIDMLLDEARIAARLHHPNVVPIVDLGSEDGLHYVVMEYVEGWPLSSILQKYRESHPPRLIIPIILDALAGLHAAHMLTDADGQLMKLVHRDVSPHNILVGVDGTARIADFGVAKAESRINSTRPGHMKGKVSFMSPEQIDDPQHIDHRSDIFSIGVVLWTALTGSSPFQGASTAATVLNILQKPIAPPSKVGLRPPAVLDVVCLRALERDPNQRTSSASDMEEALRAVASSNGLLGSKREVGQWVMAAFASELTERREVIRAAGLVVSRRTSSSGPIPVVSDYRLKAAETAPGDAPITVPPPPNYEQWTAETGVPEAPLSALPVLADSVLLSRRARRWWALPAGLFLLGLAGLAALQRSRAQPPEQAKEPAALLTAAEPRLPAPASARLELADSTEAHPAPSASRALPPPILPAKPSHPSPARAAPPSMPVPRSHASEPGMPPRPPAPPPIANEVKPKLPAWDNDSPMPPP